ncbi:MAG: hypothetical protein OXU20_41280 [Myxococcales bacterium]|nr:hypothetical protein [Myxococcales bacterium]
MRLQPRSVKALSDRKRGRRWARVSPSVALAILISSTLWGGCGGDPEQMATGGGGPGSESAPNVAEAPAARAQPATAGEGARGTSAPVGSQQTAGVSARAPAARTPDVGESGSPTTIQPAATEDNGGPSGATAWCGVRDMLATQCGNCHGSEPSFGAPMSLVSHDDLMAASPADGRPNFVVAMERIKDDRRPMPPAPNPKLLDADVAMLQAWVDAGTPTGASCGEQPAQDQPVDNEDCLDCGNYHCEDGTPMRFLAHAESTPGDTTPVDLSAVGGAVTLGDPNYYACYYFKAPWGENAIASGFRPVIDNTRVLHHWLLYASKDAPADLSDGLVRGECQAQGDPNRVLLGGWAPGRPGIRYPDDIGQELPHGPNTMLTLEIHYYNSEPGKQALDRSGGELCLASEPRPHVMGAHWLGTENINVPAGTSATPGDTCTPKIAQGQTATLFGLTPHMHEVGRHAKLEIMRADGTIEVVHDASFGFEEQINYLFDPPVVVHAEDRLRATCTFENTTNSHVGFGDGTNEEMCYLFVTAYPVGALGNGLNGCYGGFCLPGADRRCIDNENILHGIGGLF